MKKIIFIFAIIAFSILSSCKSLNQKDLSEVKSFYDGLENDSTFDWQEIMAENLERADSVYYFQYSEPINGFNVKGILNFVEDFSDDSKIGFAKLILQNDSITSYQVLPSFTVPDSIFSKWSPYKINSIDYIIKKPDYAKENQMGRFSGVPFAFYDIDFDNEEEFLMRILYAGQRERNTYFPLKYNHEVKDFVPSEFNEYLDSIYATSPNKDINWYHSLDDMTEFDRENHQVITYNSAGYIGNEKLYYKVIDKLPHLYMIETYYCDYDTLGKREVFTKGKSTVEYFNNGREKLK